ncbi:MAG TPA: S24/S26 family peptidase [Opitutaceae bacterium]|jgi:signal peptidase I|nr:S24/S26 family peptidase [Opitutaceae bacterium]
MKFAAQLRSLAAIAIVLAGSGLVRGEGEVPVSPISLETALADARALAAQHANMTVMRIEGVSMLPYFGEGSVLVVKKINAARLREGMVVVYTNRFGETVAHRLVARVDGGWQVKGWNNDRADTTVVNPGNLLGVVYATFHSSGTDSAPALYATTLNSVQVALAAPAR